jgi:hypothetical protein
MSAEQQPESEARAHVYDLFEDGGRIGCLEWRQRPRTALGWYVTTEGASGPQRLFVDTAIDELARDTRSPSHDWDLHAELAAILSTALALDAAGRALYPSRTRPSRRFRRPISAGRYEIHVTDAEPAILARAVPELHLDAISNVVVLAGELVSGGLEIALQRVTLLGGRVVAVFSDDDRRYR